MAGLCIEKLPHEECGSSDGLQVFQDNQGKFTGYCFACDTYVNSPYLDGQKPATKKLRKSAEEIQAEIEEINGLEAITLHDRKLNKTSLDHFGIKVGLSEQDGTTPVMHFYPYKKDGRVQAYKARLIEGKRMWTIGSMEGVDLFGWDAAVNTGAKRLFITEGELDAAALWQALKAKQAGTKWEGYEPAVVSLTRGSGHAAKDLAANLAPIRNLFKEVVLVFDQDEAGENATREALEVIPWARSVHLPSKDPNACLLDNRGLALANACLFSEQENKTTRIVSGASLYEAGRKQAEWGLSWPWEGFTRLTRGIRLGETIYLGAGVKMGKSEMVNTLAAHFIKEHDMPVFLAKPEEANRKSVQMVYGKMVGRHFHDPEVEFDYEAYDRAHKMVGDKLYLLDVWQYMGWQSLRSDIMTAAKINGCKAVFIDPITNLVNGIDSGQQNTMLQEVAQELAAMAKDLNIVIFIFCHLKAPLAGDAHERGGHVYSHQFAGSRAMMRSCNMMLGLEGNKDPEIDEEQRHIRKLVLLEDREFGATGYIRLYWDKRTGLFNEIKEK